MSKQIRQSLCSYKVLL